MTSRGAVTTRGLAAVRGAMTARGPVRTAWGALTAASMAVLLAGCGATPDLAQDRAAQLQADVLAVTEAVAAGQYDVAAEALAAVRSGVQEAVDSGEVSTARYDQIDEALDRTAAELEAARLLAEQAAAQAAAEQAAAEQAAAEQAAAEQAAAEQAAAEQAAAEQAANQGDDDKGDENGKGRGKD